LFLPLFDSLRCANCRMLLHLEFNISSDYLMGKQNGEWTLKACSVFYV
jgi:hypothetical protein